jgi:hypothetical protein
VSGKKVDNGSAQDADVGLRGPGPSSSRSYGCAPPSPTPSRDLDVLTGDPAGRLRPLCRPNYQTHHSMTPSRLMNSVTTNFPICLSSPRVFGFRVNPALLAHRTGGAEIDRTLRSRFPQSSRALRLQATIRTFGHSFAVGKGRAPSAKVAAQESVDPDRLLPGEPSESDQVDEAQLWITVYKDLLDTKKVMVNSATRRLAAASAEAQQEFQRTDATTLAAERRRIERRLAFWRRHLRALKVKPG